MTTQKKEKTTQKKPKFNYTEWLNDLSLNKYLKTGYVASLTKEPRTLAEAEKTLKTYLGE